MDIDVLLPSAFHVDDPLSRWSDAVFHGNGRKIITNERKEKKTR